jgi:regulator of RNase E activity RraB
MRKFQFMTMAMLAGFLLVSLPNSGEANKKKADKEKEKMELATTTKVSIQEAIKTVTANVPGTVIEAELEKEDGRTVWEVKVVTAKGELKEMYVDVQSGKIVDIEEKQKHKKSRHHKKGKGSHDQNDDDNDNDNDDEKSETQKD